MVLLSGGIDSATCAFLARRRFRARALTLSYHGIAEGELNASEAIAKSAGVVERRVVRLPDMREASDIGANFVGLPPVYIPMRNAVFYSVAASYAEEVGAGVIIGGHIRDDLSTFSDARAPFFESLQSAFREGSKTLRANRIRILRPLEKKTKPQVVRLATRLGVPLESTWSCHSAGTVHCWKCSGCMGRMKAFRDAGLRDPILA